MWKRHHSFTLKTVNDWMGLMCFCVHTGSVLEANLPVTVSVDLPESFPEDMKNVDVFPCRVTQQWNSDVSELIDQRHRGVTGNSLCCGSRWGSGGCSTVLWSDWICQRRETRAHVWVRGWEPLETKHTENTTPGVKVRWHAVSRLFYKMSK